MESPWDSSSSSSVSHHSIVPTPRSTASSSASSIDSIDSSFAFSTRIDEDEAGLVPLPPPTPGEEKLLGTMLSHSTTTRANKYRQNSAPRPAPAAVIPRRRSSLTRAINDVQDFFAKGPVIGNTRDGELVEQSQDLMFDFKAKDKFEEVEALAEGNEAQCTVMKARSTGKLFVVKHTKPVLLRNPKDREYRDSPEHKFPNEARILGYTLQPQRNIIQLMQIQPNPEIPGRFFLWMEYCSGGDLFAQIDHWTFVRRAPPPEQFLLHVYVSIMDALAFAHHGLRSRGDGRYTQDEIFTAVIHGDIKMENIFLRWTDEPFGGMPEVVLGDWGVAKRADKTDAKLDCGTPAYHAPEDVAIHQNVPMTTEYLETWLKVVNSRTTAMDIYSLGQVMYEIAARERQPRETGKDPTDLRISREYDTPGLRECIVKCLTVDKTQRAAASFEDGIGLLPEINNLRSARNTLVQRRMRLDWTEWASPA